MKKTSWLMAILMMDFSGSMDQIVDREPKQLVVKESVNQYLESTPEQTITEFIVFGTNPKKGCGDFYQKSLRADEAKKWVYDLKPGVFGKTPLAEGIKRLGALVEKYGHRSAMIITDGADTCGRDACQEIEKLDHTMKNLVAKLRLDIIGFDTQSDKRLECLKGLKDKLSRIDLALHDVDSRSGMMKALIQNQSYEKLRPEMAAVVVQGAPTDAEFTLTTINKKVPDKKKSWLGEFKVQIAPTRYRIHTNQSRTQPIVFEVFAGDTKLIPYGDFFINKYGKVNLTNEGLQLTFSPDPDTIRVHPAAKPIIVESAQDMRKFDLLFGDWTLTVTGPWWLNGVISTKVKIERGAVRDINTTEVFQDQMLWESVTDLISPAVLRIDNHKVLIMPGTKRVPYKKGWNKEWLIKR